MHEDDIKEVKSTVKEIRSDLHRWFGPNGTVWDLNDRLTRVEGSSTRAHERIDVLEVDAAARTNEMNSLALKVAGFASVPGMIALAVTVIVWMGK